MNRSALAAAVVVVAIAVAGAAFALTRVNDRVGTKPSPAPATPSPAPAVGASLPPAGSYLAAETFSEPFTFIMPTFPDDGLTPVVGEAPDVAAANRRSYNLSSAMWGVVSFHDDVSLAADMCRPSGPSIGDVPATPAAVGQWLDSAAGLVVSTPVALTVDGRPAMMWDTTTGADCDKSASRPAPWFGAEERHRIYAVPTGGDTILVITWGVNWGNGSEEYLDQVNVAADELVASMKFDR